MLKTKLERFFGPFDFKKELIGGATTFLAMAYIVVVNPSILSQAGVPFSGALTATVLLCVTMTLLMGLYAKLPFAVAPGMGVNAFFAFTLVLGRGIPWTVALGTVVWAGLFFAVVSLTPLRERVASSMPRQLRVSAAAGIGLFLAFIGFKNAGWVVADAQTLVKFGKIGLPQALAFLGLAVTLVLAHRRNPLAVLAGIVFCAVSGALAGLIETPREWLSAPDFESAFFKFDLWGAASFALLPAILSILFTDLFDSISTLMGVSQATGLLDSKGQPLRLKEGLVVDAMATLTAGAFGSSSGTAYIESAAGIEMGGRTGISAIVTALCFLPCFFLAPVAGAVPAFASAPALVYVGALMFRSVRELQLDRLEDSIPAFATLALIPLTFSITQGILWGILSHIALYALVGRRRELTAWTWGIGIACAFLIWIENH